MPKILLLFISFSLLSCFKNSDGMSVEVIEVNEIAKEAFIPKALMAEVKDDILKNSKTISPVYLFTPLQVQFTELNENVLRKPALKYSFPKGGGRIDLKDVVIGDGSFYMSFPKEQFDDNHEIMHMYYISNSPVKAIEGENFGLGCGKMLDLKKSFKKLQVNDFLKLNTNELRYLHVLAGRYVFVFRQSSQVYISQVTVSDSRYAKELCLGADL
ncbi:MAG: hypothetical protein ABL930_08965 [Pseudobdellovibrio sp.]